MAELEARLAGYASAPRLHTGLADLIPPASSYVLLLIDGLGAHQLDHPAAAPLAACRRGTIDAPFPTTTTVSLASVATGLPPRRHGWIGYFVLLPDWPDPVNSLRWRDASGRRVNYHTADLLPAPNLWERLRQVDVEPITIQPADFADTPLTKALYRGCRFEGVSSLDQHIRATVDLARVPGRLVFSYYPAVDIAAHRPGLGSSEYARALAGAATVWDRIAAYLPDGVTMIGTSDHGVVPIAHSNKHRIHRRDRPGITLFGDPRCLYAIGPRRAMEELGAELPATWYPRERLEPLWGPDDAQGNTGAAGAMARPDGAWLADKGHALLPGHMDRRNAGYHGGLDPREVEIPILVAGDKWSEAGGLVG